MYWGDFSMVEAEYTLFKEARRIGGYQYYHLISGVDLPIKTQEEIHRQCESGDNMEYIGFASGSEEEIRRRVSHYFLFPREFKSSGILVRLIRRSFNLLQDILRPRRVKKMETIEFKKGSQWVSVTERFVDYLLSKEEYVRGIFRHTLCPDEIYKQTLCWNSEFRDNLPGTMDEFEGSRRFIKWENGRLLPVTSSDIPAMFESNRWFARKFDPDDKECVSEVIRHLSGSIKD